MRTRTTAERNAIKAARVNHHIKVEVENVNRSWIDLTNLFGVNWLEAVEWGEELEQACATFALSLRRDTTDTNDLSIAPPIGGSPLNRNNAGGYAPLLDGGRNVRITTAVTAAGVAPVSGDWKLMLIGPIDSVDWTSNPVRVSGRDLGGWLVDRFIEEERAYATDVPTAMEDVMQQLINDWPPFGGAPTLIVPTSPAWMINNVNENKQSRKPLLEALQQDWALSIGWACRYRFDASDNYGLTLYEPDRADTTPDDTFAPSEYRDITAINQGIADVRNKVKGIAFKPDKTRLEYTKEDATSQNLYGVRFMEIALAPGDNVDSMTELQRLCDAACADLKDPYATHEMETLYFWPVQLHDVYAFLANGDHYDSDQTLSVVGFRHRFANGEGVTTITCSGKVKGAFRMWFRRGWGYKPGLPPSPTFKVSGVGSVDGGVTLDASTFVDVGFEPNTESVVIASETSDVLPVKDPDQSDNSRSHILRRPEGLLTQDPNWQTVVRIATTQGWYRKVAAYGIGYDGQRSKPFVDTVQCGTPNTPGTVPTPPSFIPNAFDTLDATRIAGGTTAHLTWTGTPTPSVTDEEIYVWRNGTMVAKLSPNASEWYDVGIATDIQYTYELARFSTGTLGPKIAVVLDVLSATSPVPLPLWANGAPLLQTDPSGIRWVYLAWTCADTVANELQVQSSPDGMTWNFVLSDLFTPLLIASGIALDSDLTRKYYRLATLDTSGNVRAYSDPLLWPGVTATGGGGTGSVGVAPKFVVRLTVDNTGAYNGIRFDWTCSDPNAVMIRLQDDVDALGTWNDYGDFGPASAGTTDYPNFAPTNRFRLQSLDASNTVIATSLVKLWKGVAF